MSAAKKRTFCQNVAEFTAARMNGAANFSHNMHRKIVRILGWGEAEKLFVLNCGATLIEVSRFFPNSRTLIRNKNVSYTDANPANFFRTYILKIVFCTRRL